MNFWDFKPEFSSLLEEEFLTSLKEKGHEFNSEYYFNISVDT